MNKEQYENLNDKEQAIAKESYIDGYKAAIDLVGSITIKISEHNDKQFIVHRDMIIHLMNNQLDKFKC